MSDQNVAPDAPPVEQPPVEQPAAPAAPAAPAPTPDAPWAADLASAFQDETERARVDQFMRENYQPYVTRLEQESAPARQIVEALQGEQSLETYLGLAEQLYGEDVANLLAETLIGKYDEEETPAPAAAPEMEKPAADAPAHIQEMYEQWQADKARDEYWAEMDRVKQADPRVDHDLFHPFVVGAGGDFDVALQQYQQWHDKAYAGQQPPAEETPAPPATLGADHVGGPTPPVEKRYDSLDAALNDTLAEMRANRQSPPPSVGSA